MSLLTTPRTWTSGATVTAAQMNTEIRDAFNGVQAAWDTYTPVLTATTTNPTLGTGHTQLGQYIQLGKTVICTGQMNVGTTGFNAGSGIYHWSLPIAADTSIVSRRIGTMTAVGSGGTGGFAYVADANTFSLYWFAAPPSGGASLSHSNPGAQVAGTIYDWCLVYEAA